MALGGPEKVNCPTFPTQTVFPIAVALFVHLTSNKNETSSASTHSDEVLFLALTYITVSTAGFG